jgi:molybdenum cofactor guanylyltransferase
LSRCNTPYLLTVPCDGPLLAHDLAGRLYFALTDSKADIAAASDGTRLQPVFALMKCTLLTSLLAFLAEGERKIDLWYGRHALAVADFSDRPDTFLNINTPEDRELLKARMSRDAQGKHAPDGRT